LKRYFSTILLVFFLMAGVITDAEAAPLFPPTAAYEGQFTDVQSSDWFYDNVASLYSLGLTNGKNSPSTFVPESNMTVAEVLTMAARLRSLYDLHAAEAGADLHRSNSSTWYDPYVSYLKASGIISGEFDGHYGADATRAEVAHVLANTLPAELFVPINMDTVTVGYATGKFISDVTEYTAYQQDILTLYRWGILSGMDESGSFHPESSIRRSEAAAMVTRLVDSDLRLTLNWNTEEETKEYLSLSDLVVSDGVLPAAPAPDDAAAVDAALRYMLARGERTLSFDYGAAMTDDFAARIMEAFLTGVRRYPEQTYNKISISYSVSNGKVELTFSSSLYDSLLIDRYRETIFSAAMQVRNDLYADGTLSSDMTDYDKARAYFTWLCGHCTYDDSATADAMSHSAYNVFFSQTAVCDGYTAAYNLLLKLEGIDCTAIDSKEWDHMWTVATLDGVSYHIDPTWGDQTHTVAYQYFAMTEAYSLSRFH